MSISDLIILVQQGHQQAEKQLFFRFAGKVLTLCRRYAKHDHEAKDFMQECFMHLFENIHKYDAKKGEFEGWLYRVCTNTVLQILRKEKRETPIIYLEVLPEIAPDLEEKSFLFSKQDLLKAIQELPDGYRQILNLYVFEEWSHKEIATQMNITESTSRSQYTRAKKLLKRILQKKTQKEQRNERRLVRR